MTEAPERENVAAATARAVEKCIMTIEGSEGTGDKTRGKYTTN
jgi:hypothetical protein